MRRIRKVQSDKAERRPVQEISLQIVDWIRKRHSKALTEAEPETSSCIAQKESRSLRPSLNSSPGSWVWVEAPDEACLVGLQLGHRLLAQEKIMIIN